MTGPQLTLWRITEDLSMREVSSMLSGQVTTSTLSRWEASEAEIPKWASDILMGLTRVTLPMQDMQDMLEHCVQQQMSFREALGEAIHDFVTKHNTASAAAAQHLVPVEVMLDGDDQALAKAQAEGMRKKAKH